MAPQYKLTYFNAKGLAENTRLIFAQAGVEYEDKRIDKEQWATLKETMPFGQVPALEVDGEVITQSFTIARFVAKQHGLGGKDNLAAAQADMVVDCLVDLLQRELFPIFSAPDEATKKEKKTKIATETGPKVMKNLADILEKRGGEFFAGNELTWADIVVANMIEYVAKMVGEHGDMLKDTPTLLAFKEKILNLPNIKKWIETRPVTEN